MFAAAGRRRRVQELETCLSRRAASLSGEAPPPAGLGFPCLEGPGESLPGRFRGRVTASGRGQARLGGYRPAWRWVLSQRFLGVGGGGRGSAGPLGPGAGLSHLPGEGLPWDGGRRGAEPRPLASAAAASGRLPSLTGLPVRLGVCR